MVVANWKKLSGSPGEETELGEENERLQLKVKRLSDENRRVKLKNTVLENRIKRLEEHINLLAVRCGNHVE